jgi:tellurite resistance protein
MIASSNLSGKHQDQSGHLLTAEEVRAVAKATKGDLRSEIVVAAKSLDRNIKEEMIRAAYLVLLADELIVQQEPKELKDIAAALEISEGDYGAILRDLALWLAKVRR